MCREDNCGFKENEREEMFDISWHIVRSHKSSNDVDADHAKEHAVTNEMNEWMSE